MLISTGSITWAGSGLEYGLLERDDTPMEHRALLQLLLHLPLRVRDGARRDSIRRFSGFPPAQPPRLVT